MFYSKKINPNRAHEIIGKILDMITMKGDGVIETLKLNIKYELAHINEEDKVE